MARHQIPRENRILKINMQNVQVWIREAYNELGGDLKASEIGHDAISKLLCEHVLPAEDGRFRDHMEKQLAVFHRKVCDSEASASGDTGAENEDSEDDESENEDSENEDAENHVAGGASSRSSGKIVPNFPRKAGDPDTLICQLDGCLKEVKVASIKVHIKRHHDTHFEAIYGVAMPPRFSCGWTNCHATFATRSQRPDHLLAVHGYEDDEKELNEDYVRRMSTKQLKIKFAQQAASLNKLRQTIGNLETEIHARDESYVHGYDEYLDEPQPESTSAKQDAAKQLVKLRILVRQHREIEHELKEFLESLCAEREGKLTEPEQVEDFDQEMMDT